MYVMQSYAPRRYASSIPANSRNDAQKRAPGEPPSFAKITAKTAMPAAERRCERATSWFRNGARNGPWYNVAIVRSRNRKARRSALVLHPDQVVTR